MWNASRRFCHLLVVALLLAACASSGSDEDDGLLLPEADAAPVTTVSAPVETVVGDVDSVPAPGVQGVSGEEVLLVRQNDGETSRMITIRADGSGEQLLTVSAEDGVLQLVDEFGAVELGRLWPGESRAASVVVEPTGAYALVSASQPEEVLWYRVDVAAGRVDEVVELRGMESSGLDAHADKGLVWLTDEISSLGTGSW